MRVQSFNGDESLKLARFCDRGGNTASRGGVSTMSTSTESTVAQASTSLHTAASDISNGVGSHAPQRELMTAVSTSMGLYMEDTDSKVLGSNLGIQQPQTPGSLTLGETNFTLLEESIANLNRSSGGIESLSAGSDPFSLKSEDYLPMDKSVLALDQDSFAQVGKDSSVSPRFFNDDQNTLDLLQEYDLPVSPKGEMNGSPWNLNAFYGEDDDSLLSPLVTEDPFLADITKDTKPTIINNSSLITNNKNGGDQQLLNPPVPTIKLEKESFIELSTPGVVKQENASRSYCQMSGSSSDMSSPLTVPISICGVSTSGGQTYHYGVSASQAVNLQQQDQKPVFNMYPPLTTVVDGWNRSQGFGEATVSQTGNETFSIQGLPNPNYLSPTSRQDSGSSPAASTKSTHKTCLVCSDEASGCHYGVLTCGSCKVFFKRAVEGKFFFFFFLLLGQHNYLCAGRNDCIIDKIRRKNCPACRFRKCLQAGMNLEGKIATVVTELLLPVTILFLPSFMLLQLFYSFALILVSKYRPYSFLSFFIFLARKTKKLNKLKGLKFKKIYIYFSQILFSYPGFRSLHLDDRLYDEPRGSMSWLLTKSFSLKRKIQKYNGIYCYLLDLVISRRRMKLPYMSEQCEQMLKISNELVRLQLSYDEYLCMKVLLLLSSVPKEGLKSQGVFDEIRMTYIKELGKAIVKREENSSQNWQRFYQLTKLLDSMHELVGGLLNFCFYTFVNKSLSVEFPEMLAEMISNQLPKFKAGSVKSLLFHQK
ncbi:glucocorticoid receptor [Huso huso]|uniref:Glucocorticoid receptor n=1 Tax=Huso huso TaxID=61971 RepID=A0ABR0YT49_HUSHU